MFDFEGPVAANIGNTDRKSCLDMDSNHRSLDFRSQRRMTNQLVTHFSPSWI
jgi:hypothetical protein